VLGKIKLYIIGNFMFFNFLIIFGVKQMVNQENIENFIEELKNKGLPVFPVFLLTNLLTNSGLYRKQVLELC